MKSPHTYDHPTRALIDLDAFRANIAAVRSCVGPEVRIMAIVKADAYGHGSDLVTTGGIDDGIDAFGVARAPEAYELREGGVAKPILVFDLVQQEQVQRCLALDLQLTVATVQEARMISAEASRAGVVAAVHAEVDTGMGRLGFAWEQAPALIEQAARLPRIRLAGVFSHFATAESDDQSYARLQVERFERVLAELGTRKVEVPLRHMANSGAIVGLPEARFDMVRPGIILYGSTPKKGMRLRHPVRPVLSFVSRVGFTKQVEPGTSISYGRRYVAEKKTTIATVPIGYGDGYSRLLTGKGEALIRGKRFPVVGAVCMDQIMVDAGNGSGVSAGDDVTLIGRDGNEEITAWDIAEKIQTIPYEVTCLISPRVARIGISSTRPSARTGS